MAKDVYSGQNWGLGSLPIFRDRLAAKITTMEVWRRIAPIFISRLTATLAERGEKKPSTLIGRVMSWPIAVGARSPDDTSSIVDPETWILDIPALTNADKRHELHVRLRAMVVFHFGLLYWQLRDRGYSVEDTKTKVGELVSRSTFALEVSYEGAMQDMRELISALYGVDHDEFRTRKRAENLVAPSSPEKTDVLLAERVRALTSLCLGLQQARRHEALVNRLATENVRKGKLPRPVPFMRCLSEQISTPVTPQQLIDIAVLGRVNPARLWPQFQHVHDLFELCVFLGDRLMALPRPATPELGDTFRREIRGEGSPKACKSGARANRLWFADAIRILLRRPVLAASVRDLQTA